MRKRRGDWMTTFTGRRFWPLDPAPEDVDIADIAHALANLCRFAGHCREFYCVTPEMRVLTSDLRWVPAGDLMLGDSLLAPEEEPRSRDALANRRRRRHLVPAVVVHVGRIHRPVYRLRLSDGTTLRSSSDHPWLFASKRAGNQQWITTGQIAADVAAGRKRYALRFMRPWEKENTYEGGRLSALFDGEGHVTRRNTSGQRSNGFALGLAQNKGRILAEIEDGLRVRGVAFASRQNPRSNTWNVTVKGEWADRLSVMGRLRPVRLIDRLEAWIREGALRIECHGSEKVEIAEAVFQGDQEVVALETTAHTYFAEGFGAHNSVGQHSVLVSEVCSAGDALAGLLHDAAEAYVIDMPRPLKRDPSMAAYCAAEGAVLDVVLRRFGLPATLPEGVRHADEILLATEARDLMDTRTCPWGLWGRPLPARIDPWTPTLAEHAFLRRFEALRRRDG